VDTFRLGLHVLAATIWVGGQFVLAGLVPTVRKLGPDATRAVASRFNTIAWPAYVLLLFTGIWNLFENSPMPSSWHPLIEIKVTCFLLSGLGAFLHTRAKGNKAMLAIGGASASLFAVAALFMGIALRFQ
jgi:putative copper export protein